MRIAIGQLSHETNTMFGPPTPVEEFQRQEWLHGQEILEQNRGVRTYLGGMIDAAEEREVELVPGFATTAHPSGTIERAAFDRMLAELLAGIREAGEIDAVCLALHGAGSAEGVDDIEGAILEAVRGEVGTPMPVIATLDLHVHMTDRMVEHATALLDVHEYPHVDCYERGYEAIDLAVRTVRGEISPAMHLVVLPMFIPPTTSFHGPAYEVNQRCHDWESRGLLDVTFGHGYPHTDVPIISSSVLAIADGDGGLAKEAATDVARMVWDTREAFRVRLPDGAEAVRRALEFDGGPVVIAEISDNPGGGSPGDGTHLLRALIEADRPATTFGFVVDRVTAAEAHAAGPGATIPVRIGGRHDPDLLGPARGSDRLRQVRHRREVPGPVRHGRGARFAISARWPASSSATWTSSSARSATRRSMRSCFLLHGIDVTRYRVVALKSQNHFLSGFEPLAAEIIRCDPPGWTPGNVAALDYRRIRRPIWPLDEGATWDR